MNKTSLSLCVLHELDLHVYFVELQGYLKGQNTTSKGSSSAVMKLVVSGVSNCLQLNARFFQLYFYVQCTLNSNFFFINSVFNYSKLRQMITEILYHYTVSYQYHVRLLTCSTRFSSPWLKLTNSSALFIKTVPCNKTNQI